MPLPRTSRHLRQAKQGYIEHACDSLTYAFMALRAAFFFFAHAVHPDSHTSAGSTAVAELHNMLQSKIAEMNAGSKHSH